MDDTNDWKSRLSRVIRSNANKMADKYEEFEEQGGFQSIGESVKRGFEEFAGYVKEGYREATGDSTRRKKEDVRQARDPDSRDGRSRNPGDPMGRDGTTEGHTDDRDATAESTAGSRQSRTHTPPKSEEEKTLRDYYANLEVDYGADMKTVKQSYRRLMRRYHPDNFADDSDMQQLATELTQELSHAYEQIREHKEG